MSVTTKPVGVTDELPREEETVAVAGFLVGYETDTVRLTSDIRWSPLRSRAHLPAASRATSL
jgi:hypothetical protein